MLLLKKPLNDCVLYCTASGKGSYSGKETAATTAKISAEVILQKKTEDYARWKLAKRYTPSVNSTESPDCAPLIMRTTRLKHDEQQRTASFVSSKVNSNMPINTHTHTHTLATWHYFAFINELSRFSKCRDAQTVTHGPQAARDRALCGPQKALGRLFPLFAAHKEHLTLI